MVAMAHLDFGASGGLMERLETAGGGSGSEDMVQDFVSVHMLSILQPFSHHLKELQAQVAQLGEAAAAASEDQASQASRLDNQERTVACLEAGGQDLSSRLDKALGDLAALKKEKSRLDGNHEMTKAGLAKTKDTLSALAATAEAARQDLGEAVGRIGVLERGLAETEKRIMEHVEGRLDKQGRVCKEVNERQVEMLKSCQQAKALGDSASAAIKKLTEVTHHYRCEDLESVRNLREELDSAKAGLREVEQLVHAHTDGLKAADREVQHLRTWTEQLRELKQVQMQHSQVGALLQEQGRRLDSAEEHIAQLHGAGSARQLQDSDLCDLKEVTS